MSFVVRGFNRISELQDFNVACCLFFVFQQSLDGIILVLCLTCVNTMLGIYIILLYLNLMKTNPNFLRKFIIQNNQ